MLLIRSRARLSLFERNGQTGRRRGRKEEESEGTTRSTPSLLRPLCPPTTQLHREPTLFVGATYDGSSER